jgi:hypothetical protein
MATIIEILERLTTWSSDWKHPAWKQYVLTGDQKLLKQLPDMSRWYGVDSDFLAALNPPQTLDPLSRRTLEAFFAARLENGLGQWLGKSLAADVESLDEYEAGRKVLKELGCWEPTIAYLTAVHVRPLLRGNGQITSAGAALCKLKPTDLKTLVDRFSKQHEYKLPEIAPVLAAHAPEPLAEVLQQRLEKKELLGLRAPFWKAVLEQNRSRFEPLAAKAFASYDDSWECFQIGRELAGLDLAKYGPAVEQRALKYLKTGIGTSSAEQQGWAEEAAIWLLTHAAQHNLPALKELLAADPDPDNWGALSREQGKATVVDCAAKQMQRAAIPLFEACFLTEQPLVQFHALQHWISFKNPTDNDRIIELFRVAIASKDSVTVPKILRCFWDWNANAVEADVWSLLGHKSRAVREIAASLLAKLGEARIGKVKELWTAKRADTRIATISWLKGVGTTKAIAELKLRLEVEEDDNVRDTLLLAIEKLVGPNAKPDLVELEKRIKKTLAHLDKLPVWWLLPAELPLPKLRDGKKLDVNRLRYLLYRQSRVKEMRADIEAKPLYAMLDRATSGDLALAVVQGFFSTKMDAEDRWVMAFAAVVGDDRLVPLLVRQIRTWADASRGKLAEYAVGALALLGTDSALLAVDAMAIRYRAKNKNIGKAAAEAFTEAAQARGLTPEELGDVVVPWLGFEPGQPRLVDAGKAKVEVRITEDFKFAFRDPTTNKKIAKLPDCVPASVKNEFKELSATLKEATKSQLLRMETLMVRQFRWTVKRWRELYLQHPLLLPFAHRLIWGCYDAKGKLSTTFRALEDHTLTDSGDDVVELPGQGNVGVIHPLELAASLRQAWLKHLADYNIVPPFAQLERPVVTVKPEQKDMKYGSDVVGTELNAMTFKGRAERLGWARGSVVDAGGVHEYLKTFPTAGVDVFIYLEGMYIGIGMDASITLDKFFFVKHGSVKIGSYEYDEPSEASDPRLVPFGEVPAIAFSEAIGDLAKIAGKQAAPETE